MFVYRQPDNLVKMIEQSIARNPDNPMFGTKQEDGTYAWITYRQVGQRIDNLRAGLAQLGIGPGDAVGIIASNRVEWAVAAYATFGLGGRFIPMYEKELVHIWQHIINDGGIKVLFAANEQVYAQLAAFRKQTPHLQHLFVIDGQSHPCMAEIESRGASLPVPSQHPDPQQVAVLIYTSGTTGRPKGVLLSHGNFTSNMLAGSSLFPNLNSSSRSLSILPWAHSYAQTAELYTFCHLGASIGFVEDVTTVAEDMAKVAPTFLIAVPRVFNKIYDGLWAKMNETGGIALKLFRLGLDSAARKRTLAAEGKSAFGPRIAFKLAAAVVFRKIRKRFGGCLQGAMTASAMMNLEVARFFVDIGIPVYDCYGLTETSPAISINCPASNKPGSVGRPIEQVSVWIDTSQGQPDSNEGEIVVYGPNIMQGYHNNPQATRAVMTPDGGLRTGDQGRLDEDGFLFITGRIKEQFKLENGKYVFPAALEEQIRLLPWVENVMIYGDGLPYTIALVVPDFERLKSWARDKGFPTETAQLRNSLPVREMIEQAIQEYLQGKFGRYEIPKSCILIEDNFSVESGTLTQTLKLKRRKVIERYLPMIQRVYDESRRTNQYDLT
jgi:long-chain acyl-CoA synthetase